MFSPISGDPKNNRTNFSEITNVDGKKLRERIQKKGDGQDINIKRPSSILSRIDVKFQLSCNDVRGKMSLKITPSLI